MNPHHPTESCKEAPSGKKGLVSEYLQNTAHSGVPIGLSAPYVIGIIRGGLAYSELETLRSALDLPMEDLAAHIGISRNTLQRRKISRKPLNPVESDRIVRLARLTGKAVDVFGDISYARQWLKSPQHGLGGLSPLDYSDTGIGTDEVLNLLGRIEHGVFS